MHVGLNLVVIAVKWQRAVEGDVVNTDSKSTPKESLIKEKVKNKGPLQLGTKAKAREAFI